MIAVLSMTSCKQSKSEKTVLPEIVTKVEVEETQEASIFNTYNGVHKMIQGSWSNKLDPNSVIIFKENTSTNMYQDVIVQKDVPYTISANCINEANTNPSNLFKYVNTQGTYAECYKIQVLDDKVLIMEFEKGDITLTFGRVNEAL